MAKIKKNKTKRVQKQPETPPDENKPLPATRTSDEPIPKKV